MPELPIYCVRTKNTTVFKKKILGGLQFPLYNRLKGTIKSDLHLPHFAPERIGNARRKEYLHGQQAIAFQNMHNQLFSSSMT